MAAKREYLITSAMLTGVFDFDPDQPWDENGRWTSALQPAVEYPERVEYWKEKILAGEDRPILVDIDDHSRIIDGNHTLAAYQALNQSPDIYAMPRLQFLNEAAKEDDTVEYIRKAIKAGKAVKL